MVPTDSTESPCYLLTEKQCVPELSNLPGPAPSTKAQSRTIKITCLPKTVTKASLTELVEKHGKLMTPPKILGSKNKYAWVNFESMKGALNAVTHLDGYCFDGSTIRVSLKPTSIEPVDCPHQLSTIIPRDEHSTLQKKNVRDQQIRITPIEIEKTKVAEAVGSSAASLSQDGHDKLQKKTKKDKIIPISPNKRKSKACGKDHLKEHFTCSSFEDLWLKINSEQINIETNCYQQTSELKHSHDIIQFPKKCPLELFQELHKQKGLLMMKIDDIKTKQQEFLTVCEKLCTQCSSADMSSHSLKELERQFLCERLKYNKGLPIYSYRRQIVDMIKKHQVSILTAETGSGKSTQLVQYLYEEGFSTAGIIVCTQPRKVAAVSLADYVSSEMLSDPGSIVGYKTGVRGCHSVKHTKVLYVTDHTLLNECVVDPDFSKYSCLVVDEAHERSLTTDILLAFIKKCLPRRLDLRVVITSATIDPTKFIQYFGADCPVKQVPGRSFPVEVMYCPQISKEPLPKRVPEYVSRAIDIVGTLHKNEPSGDILIFLTSPAEVEQACQNLELLLKSTACIFPLHGKLQPEDQQRVFKDYPQRKIIFSTNVAETSITIPGVKYIVDSGVAKELCFNAKKNINSLKVRPISKSSAEQRKGRAGRTSAGKCYRLYSEDEYESMSDQMVPEILRVSLSGTVLKLYELGITDVYNFDFIEKPEYEALKFAVQILQFLGAIHNDKLTAIGKSMAVLPVDPRLAKVILDGLEEGVGLEAISMAAISSQAGTVFFRSGSDESKEQSDLLKSTFCVLGGDQLTDFNAYSQWISLPFRERSTWCVKNSINAKSMRLVQDTITDVTEIVKKQLKVKIDTNSFSFEKASNTLPQIFFKSFANNLCVFLGHEKVGYLNPHLPDENFVIFPGSSVCKLNSQPKFLIYEKTLKTSQHFLLLVLPVKEEWVEEALESGLLAHHPMECDQFLKLAVTPFVVEHLGVFVMNHITRNRKLLFDKPALSQLQIDYCQLEGTLKVFVLKSGHELARELVKECISSVKNELRMYCFETGVSEATDNVRVLVGSGGSISKILMPHEYRCLFIKGPKGGDWDKELLSSLRHCGTIQKEEIKETCIRVTFHEPDDAVKASRLIVPPGVSLMPDQPRKSDRLNISSFTITMEWSRRERQNFVNLNFRTPDRASRAISDLLAIDAVIAGAMVRLRISKHDVSHVFVSNVPTHFPEEAIRNEFDQLLTRINYLRGSYDVIFAYSKQFSTTEEEYEELQEKLHSLLSSIPKTNYSLNLLKPADFHKIFVAYVNFISINEGMSVVDALHNAHINYKPFKISRLLSSSIKYSASLYAVVEKSVQEVSDRVRREYTEVKITNSIKDGNNILTIKSSNPTDHIAVLKCFNSVLEPEVMECTSPLYFEYMTSKKCEEDIIKIQNLSFTVVRRDFRLKCIKIYGLKENAVKAKAEFVKSLSFCVETNCYKIGLKRSGQRPGLLKFLITTYGIDLHLLTILSGIEMARIDIHKQQLILFASDFGYQTVKDIIDKFCKSKSPCSQAHDNLVTTVECCACYTLIDITENLYRLEDCGHAYHFDCIEAQLAQDAVTIPIECAAEDCTSLFVWQDFENLKLKGKVNLQTIITKSVRVYVAANKETVHNCPTPDCSMVYIVTEEIKCFLCIHCGVLTCTKCHRPFHSGLTCTQDESAAVADKGLVEWLKEDTTNRKRCPKCSAAIEKNGGCAHVTCLDCGSHICWHCLKFFNAGFNAGSDCYDHLQMAHGGFY